MGDMRGGGGRGEGTGRSNGGDAAVDLLVLW